MHYETAEAAQDAIQKFNGNFIDDHEVHVLSFVRRQDRAGQNDWTNLYVKQFPTSWDEERIKDLFSPFGTVASVIIQREADGKSKGFGFVNFAEHPAAEKALAELANKSIEDPLAAATNAANAEAFAKATAEAAESAKEGEAKEEGKADGEAKEGEEKKDEEKKEAPTKPAEVPATFELYVNRAQKKSERTREIKTRIDALNHERVSKYQGMNLYVKNLDDTITDDLFREAFAAHGTITSARVMRDAPPPAADGTPGAPSTGISRGFGFVCYSSPEEATRAVTEMNGKLIKGKPIVVTLHQRKDLRRAHLAQTYAPRPMRAASYPQGPGMPMPYGMGMYGPGQSSFPSPRGPAGGFPGYPSAGGQFSPRGGSTSPRGMPYNTAGRGAGPAGPSGGYYMPAYGMPPPQGQQMMQGGVSSPGGFKRMPNGQPLQPMGGPGPSMGPQGGRFGAGAGRGPPTAGRGMQMAPAGGRGMLMGQQMGQMQMGQMQRPGTGVAFKQGVRNQGGPMMGQQQSSQGGNMSTAVPGIGEPLDDQALAAADPQMQKNMIGERLYPLIYVHQPQLAGKITGMLLEMDNAELLNLIESPESLMSKVRRRRAPS